jgi:hypothetical protein
VAEEVLPAEPQIPEGAREIPLLSGRDPIQLNNGRFLLEFVTQSNCTYYIQYSTNLSSGFKTAIPAITASGNRIQWLDDGPPKTESKPGMIGQRFYRVFESCP